MNYTRAEINLGTVNNVTEFVKCVNSDGSADKYILEDKDRNFRADARSLLGVMYAATEYNGLYLVNTTHDGVYPHGIDDFRR